jgi:hypothetical protein
MTSRDVLSRQQPIYRVMDSSLLDAIDPINHWMQLTCMYFPCPHHHTCLCVNLILHNRFKWKPPSRISVDFFLELRFPPLHDQNDCPDVFAMPLFLLKVRHKRNLIYFDSMLMQDEDWEKYGVISLRLGSALMTIISD